MGKWFNQAAEIDTLRRQLRFAQQENEQVQNLLDREESRNKLLESDLKSERKAHNLALRRVADLVCRQEKLPQPFAKDIETVPEIELPDEEEDKYTWAATEMRNADLASGINLPLEQYIERIKANPNQVFL